MSDNDHLTEKQKNNKLSKFTKFIAVVLVFALLFILIIGYFVASNRLSISFKSPNDEVVVSSNVCGNEFVSRYNQVMSKQFDIDEKTDYKERVDELLKGVRAQKGYNDDPTCQYVEYKSNLLYNRDYDSARKNVELIKDSATRGVYVDTRIYNLSSVDSMLDSVDYYKFEQESELIE